LKASHRHLCQLVCKCFLCQEHESPPPSVVPIETEREKELSQQLKQANDTAARLQDELRQAKDRERQLEMQLDKMEDDISQTKLEKKESDDTKQRIVLRREQTAKSRDSKINCILHICFRFTTMIIICTLIFFMFL